MRPTRLVDAALAAVLREENPITPGDLRVSKRE
jgi:hypothetical protein